MKNIAKIVILAIAMAFTMQTGFTAQDVWINDARAAFSKHVLQIYEINLRTFNASDTNGNGIIDFDDGEESGNFLNAIQRLDGLAQQGINTIDMMPIMAVGKTKALGTAGSLYAPSSFTDLNPQLGSPKTALTLESQAIKFINEAHRRKFRGIVDRPACGSYDLFLKHPELFVKDKSGQGVIPSDWTDLRLFNSGTETNVNRDVYNLYKDYVTYVMKLGVDGIKANVATSKPAAFWKDLIAYSRTKDPQFLWIAEATEDSTEPIAPQAIYTPYNKLLEAGFDGYFGSFGHFREVKSAREFMNYIKFIMSLQTKYSSPKSVIGSFATHDELSPVLDDNLMYTDLIFWLNAALPINSFIVDGVPTGDGFIYFWANKKATKTFTDDDEYFVHRGKIDIFNFSRMPGGTSSELIKSFAMANNTKNALLNIYNAPDFKFKELKTSSPQIFSFAISGNQNTVIISGNVSNLALKEVSIYIPKYEDKNSTIPLKLTSIPISSKGKMTTQMYPYEIQIMLVEGFEIK